MRIALLVLLISVRAFAGADSGFIGRDAMVLDIDNCPAVPDRPKDEITKIAAEHYNRGETLYLQGDYAGTVTELVASYCLTPYYSMLKDIGQAYERQLEYEKAIAYYERFVLAVPSDAKRQSQCSPDPQEEKQNMIRRSETLRRLPARVRVVTIPKDTTIVLSNELGMAGRASSDEEIPVPGGTYKLRIEHEGFHTIEQDVHVEVGRPYTLFQPMEPITGRLRVRVVPSDARIFLDKRQVGTGVYEGEHPRGRYTIAVEAPDRMPQTREVEVLPDRDTDVSIEMPAEPQVGRRQFLVYAGFAGAVAGGTITGAQNNGGVDVIGVLGGATAGLATAYWGTPHALALGTSSLTITSSLIGGGVGAAVGAALTANGNVIAPLIGSGLVAGAFAGYYAGEHWHVTPGDAAVINSGALWGTTAGVLFTVSFQEAGRKEDAALILSGLAMGSVGGVLLERYFTISRGHAALIDASGVAGLLAGLATEGVVNRITNTTDQRDEQTANYALGGMMTGLVIGGILTRNMDEPTFAVRPTMGKATTAAGGSTTTFGIGGSF